MTAVVAVAELPVQLPDDPVVFWFKVGTSPEAIVPHDGAAEAEPEPVCVKNFLVDDVLPANLDAVGVAFS